MRARVLRCTTIWETIPRPGTARDPIWTGRIRLKSGIWSSSSSTATPSGVLHPLPDKHVDTGMGFERICTVLQGVESTYDTDLFQPILAAIGEISGRPYNDENRVAMRVIADHVRTLCFAVADGVLPSNEGRGYVLRRILRRAARYGRTLGMHDPFIHGLVPVVVRVMGDVFPEVAEQAGHISRVIRSEEEGFGKTLDRGLEMFEVVSREGRISGRDAFRLYDTYGFPIDLTQLMGAERGLAVDLQGFEEEMAAQQARSREAGRRVFASQEAVSDDFLPDEHSVFSRVTSVLRWIPASWRGSPGMTGGWTSIFRRRRSTPKREGR